MDIWNMHQHWRLQHMAEDKAYQDEKIGNIGIHLENLGKHFNEKLNQLTLICQAMWSLIEENTNLTEEDLNNRINKLDLHDGKLDGKIAENSIKCEKCGAVIPGKKRKCQFCGYNIYKEENTFKYE